ncbi:odorant-binding protein-like [Lagenorhynchus albirostris]|uniref:odorant-binding protein-like n=1 Tax=Lagenorhynchus albirostris TaxID=27610 RepID=UPI0028EEA676|nr:odorant-binding protein-like [Lagenorhynchus albirostris]
MAFPQPGLNRDLLNPGEFCFHLSGEWKTLYVASNNPEKTSENGPFKVYMRNIHLDDENDRAAFNFFVKSYVSKNKIKIIPLSENALRMYSVNMDELDKTTKLTGLTGRGTNMEEEDFETFKQMTREEGTPEENTVNVTEAGECDKKDVVHMYNGILLSHKKEGNNAVCSNMDRPRDDHTE